MSFQPVLSEKIEKKERIQPITNKNSPRLTCFLPDQGQNGVGTISCSVFCIETSKCEQK